MRQIVNLNRKWAFTMDAAHAPTALPKPAYYVNLPHCFNAIDGQDGGGDYHRGLCWYVKTLSFEDLPEGEKLFLEIRGANSSADLYVAGRHVAHHDGGYALWRAEVTHDVNRTGDTLIAIGVDNSPSDHVYPQMADFTFYGGLYRDVSLIGVPASHFDLEFYGAPGIAVTPVMDGKNANVKIKAYLTNAKDGQTLRWCIAAPGGEVIAQGESPASKTVMETVIRGAHLWHGRRDPYLYTATAQLCDGDQVLDTVSTRFGCRSFSIDPERGFILNGESYPLRGVSRHQDRWGVGNALLPEHHREDMALIAEVGANTIRLAHYQHDPYVYDLCDEYGMVVWAEIPYISQHLPRGQENTISQMKELIYQNYNHPSIVVWGISNEITMQGEKTPGLLENHRALNDLCHALDSTRLTTMAIVSMCPMDAEYIRIPDTVAWNHYFGWYGGDTSMNGPWFDKFHALYPHIPVACSEYGCEGLNWHTSAPAQGDYTEEYQAHYHEELIRQLFPRQYLWATYVWNMFDFGADNRAEGGENGQNHKGLVTFDRTYKKDAFYAYKAWLSDEPFVHICGKRYAKRAEDVTRVTVYSNQPQVELFANGVSLGKKEAKDHFFYFDVPLSGATRLLASAGSCRDESEIVRVDSFNEAYRLREKGAVLNWFDVKEKAGHFSLNDKLSDIMAVPEGEQLITGMLKQLTLSAGKDSMMAAFSTTPAMMQMLGGFTVLRLVGLMGAANVKVSREQLLDLNATLNRIRKPQ